jgi:hypothetical protein
MEPNLKQKIKYEKYVVIWIVTYYKFDVSNQKNHSSLASSHKIHGCMQESKKMQ